MSQSLLTFVIYFFGGLGCCSTIPIHEHQHELFGWISFILIILLTVLLLLYTRQGEIENETADFDAY